MPNKCHDYNLSTTIDAFRSTNFDSQILTPVITHTHYFQTHHCRLLVGTRIRRIIPEIFRNTNTEYLYISYLFSLKQNHFMLSRQWQIVYEVHTLVLWPKLKQCNHYPRINYESRTNNKHILLSREPNH